MLRAYRVWVELATKLSLAQVLATIRANMLAPPKPFASTNQYSKAREEWEEGESEEPKPKKSKKHKNAKPKKCKRTKRSRSSRMKKIVKKIKADEEVGYKPGKFAARKKEFIAGQRANGATAAQAALAWDQSTDKRSLLSQLSLGELKKRRFVDKACAANPWA